LHCLTIERIKDSVLIHLALFSRIFVITRVRLLSPRLPCSSRRDGHNHRRELKEIYKRVYKNKGHIHAMFPSLCFSLRFVVRARNGVNSMVNNYYWLMRVINIDVVELDTDFSFVFIHSVLVTRRETLSIIRTMQLCNSCDYDELQECQGQKS
jgi:hypothetical protein